MHIFNTIHPRYLPRLVMELLGHLLQGRLAGMTKTMPILRAIGFYILPRGCSKIL
jgi:hypothetical protein